MSEIKEGDMVKHYMLGEVKVLYKSKIKDPELGGRVIFFKVKGGRYGFHKMSDFKPIVPKFNVGDKVKWADNICKIKYVTPEKSGVDNEYQYVIIEIEGNNIGNYFLVYEGNLKGVE